MAALSKKAGLYPVAKRRGANMLKKILSAAVILIAVSACQGDSHKGDATIAAAKAGYDAFAVGDMDAWAQTQGPDVKWAIPKGVYEHKPGLRGFSKASEGPLNLN